VVVLWAARHIYGGGPPGTAGLKYIGYGGRGKQVRDMLHVDDLLRLVLYQIEHLNELSGEVFNVGGGVDISASLLELTKLCREITGKTVDINSEPQDRPADVPLYLTDAVKVMQKTGWKPQRDVRSTIEEICAWITGKQGSAARNSRNE